MRSHCHFVPVASLLVLAGLLPACRSAAPSARPGATPSLGFLAAYVGQQRIVLAFSDARRLAFTRQDAAKKREGCDLAVEIRDAQLAAGTLRLRLEVLGRPRIEGQPARRTACRATLREVELAVSGFAGNENAETVQSLVDLALPTPEGYLKSHGVTFEPKSSDDLKATLASADPTAGSEQQSLWRRLSAQPRVLLRVDAELHTATHKVKHEGETEFSAVVGSHGRLRDIRIGTPLAADQEAHVRRVLGLWRYEPARTKDGPTPAAVSARLVLKID